MKRREAKAAGLGRYFTGVPCARGHLAERSTSGGHCIECVRLRWARCREAKRNRARAAYAANPEKFRAKRRQAYAADLEHSRAKSREAARRKYRKRHPNAKTRAEIVAEAAARRVARQVEVAARKAERAAKKAASAERERERARKYRVDNRECNLELQRRWREANKDKRRAHKRARRRAKAATLRERLFKLQRGRCAYCRNKLTIRDMHVDHIQPVSKGGPDKSANFQLTCSTCNLAKSAKDPIVFAREIGRLV